MKQLEEIKDETKLCSYCGKYKSKTLFNKCNATKDKLYKWCRQCVKEYRIDYFERVKRGENRLYQTQKRRGYNEEKFKEERKVWQDEIRKKLEYIITHKEEYPKIFKKTRYITLHDSPYGEYKDYLKNIKSKKDGN